MKNGKEIEAVYFVYEAGLTEQFPPLPLLKTYLSNSRKIANNISKKGKYSMSAVVCGKILLLCQMSLALCINIGILGQHDKVNSEPSFSFQKRIILFLITSA